MATRFEPEVFVPPLPGPAGQAGPRPGPRRGALLRPDDPAPAGRPVARRRAGLPRRRLPRRDPRRPRQHLAGSAASPRRRPTPCSCSTRCSTPRSLGAYATNTKALVFNVKGEDLLWLDRPNAQLDDEGPRRVRAARAAGRAVRVGRAVGAAAARRGRLGRGRAPGGAAIPQVEGRTEGVTAYYWTIREFVRERYLRFLFAEGGRRAVPDRRPRRPGRVAPRSLVPGRPRGPGDGPSRRRTGSSSFEELCDAIALKLDDDDARLARPAVRGHGRRLPAPARGGPPPGRPPHLGHAPPRIPPGTGSTGRRTRSRSSTSTTSTTGRSGS